MAGRFAVVGLARHCQRSPDQISEAKVQTYLLDLIRERKRAWSTCSIVVHGLRSAASKARGS